MTDLDVDSMGGLSRTSSTLLAGAQSQQGSAWTTLVDLYGPLIYQLCRRQGLQAACAADVTQEVLIAVSRKLGDYRHDIPGASFRGWLRTIAWNKIRDYARAKVRVPVADGGTDAQGMWLRLAAENGDTTCSQLQDPNAESLRMQDAMQVVQSEVGEQKWLMFCAVVLDGHSPVEVAKLFETSVNVVYLAKSRILQRLRAVLSAATEASE
jgi:RNA polymerase sigma-70 factor, ECF subfamily